MTEMKKIFANQNLRLFSFEFSGKTLGFGGKLVFVWDLGMELLIYLVGFF